LDDGSEQKRYWRHVKNKRNLKHFLFNISAGKKGTKRGSLTSKFQFSPPKKTNFFQVSNLILATKMLLEDKRKRDIQMAQKGFVKNRILNMHKSHSFEHTTSKYRDSVYKHINNSDIYRPTVFGIDKERKEDVEIQIGAKSARGIDVRPDTIDEELGG
jgi:hypothetical protein